MPYKPQGQNLDEFPHLKRWFDAIAARPATVRTYEGVAPAYVRDRSAITDDERKHLFGQTAPAAKSQ